MEENTCRVRICEARDALHTIEGLTGQSFRRFDEIVGRFELSCNVALGIELLGEVTLAHVEQFVMAKSAEGPPSISTQHLRRSVLRVLFRVAHNKFGFESDPTHRLILPPRSALSARPLTSDEVSVGRSFSLNTLTATRQPAAWALCEATATTAELPHLVVADLDLDCSDGPRVWLHGSRKRDERWGLLDDWGAVQLERRATSLRGTPHLIKAAARKRTASVLAVRHSLTRWFVPGWLVSLMCDPVRWLLGLEPWFIERQTASKRSHAV